VFSCFQRYNYSAALDIVQILEFNFVTEKKNTQGKAKFSCTFELRNSNSRDLKSVAEQQSIYEIFAPILSGQASSRESGAQQQSRDQKKEFYLKIH
jgi:hypothetical protein